MTENSAAGGKALSRALKAEARSLGFNLAGIVAARPGQTLNAYLAWIARGYHGEMAYMARPDRVTRRQDPRVIFPELETIICVGLDYRTIDLPPAVRDDPARGRISNYAWGVDYHRAMTPRLERLAAWLRGVTGDEVRQRVYVDTGALLERDHAASAGLGFVGKNTMLIAPRRGSFIFLGELLTSAPLPSDAPPAQPGCGACQRCLVACPTGAFPRPYVLDARRCISYLTIELKGSIPRPLRPLLGNWVYGCDVCQEVCPFNRFAPRSTEVTLYPAQVDEAAPPLLTLLTLDAETFARRFAYSPIKRLGHERLLRNACVAAGNWGDAATIPALAALLDSPSPLVRGHAAWGLGQVGGDAARRALASAARREVDESVLEEIRDALSLA